MYIMFRGERKQERKQVDARRFVSDARSGDIVVASALVSFPLFFRSFFLCDWDHDRTQKVMGHAIQKKKKKRGGGKESQPASFLVCSSHETEAATAEKAVFFLLLLLRSRLLLFAKRKDQTLCKKEGGKRVSASSLPPRPRCFQ